MKVVDLRNIFTSCNDVLIEISDTLIYYAEEKLEEGHPSLFLLAYDRVTKRERILANYVLTNPAYVQHFFSFPEDIVVVMESGGSEAWVFRLDKRTGAEKDTARLNFIGGFAGCCALDETHILFYSEPNEKHRQLFQEYQKLTGFSRVVYLYDLEEGKYYYVRDPRVCNSDSSRFITYRQNGSVQLLVLEPHGSEEEKQHCYRNMRWLGDNVNDNVWTCPLSDFVVSVKSGEERAPLELILSAGTAGLVRYAGIDEKSLYFRAKYFPTGDQRICAIDRETGKKSVAARLTLEKEELPAWFSIDAEGGRAYRVTLQNGEYEVKGMLNSSVSGRYPEDLGRFVTCVDDRFIIAQYILADNSDSFEFNSIYDLRTGVQKSYECRCAVKGENVVIY
ncbi:MAG: hypothetical protein LKJ45_08080 [Oscillospiraceae bacterium]|jgi:hypothetical protein|nr:hypothetical protein [Oscillospiraceae bacterium]